MPAWNQLLKELEQISSKNPKEADKWLNEKINTYLFSLNKLREGNNVIFYGSAYLQKPAAQPYLLQITHEDLNGFMTTMHGMDWKKGLTLILHTPGGMSNATETILDYLNRKFKYIEVIIPAYAMSAGTMISLSSHKLIMGRQSQLGPIDPQLPLGNSRYTSALAIKNQFLRAQNEILENKGNAHVWAPALASLGPALLQEAENAINYGEGVVKNWLLKNMFKDKDNKEELAAKAAEYFSQCEKNTSHGRRINRDEVRSQGIEVEDLESNQDLQETVMTLHHLFTLIFEKSPAAKIIAGSKGTNWVKNIPQQKIVPSNLISGARKRNF